MIWPYRLRTGHLGAGKIFFGKPTLSVSVVVVRPFRGYPIDNYMFALMVP